MHCVVANNNTIAMRMVALLVNLFMWEGYVVYWCKHVLTEFYGSYELKERVGPSLIANCSMD